MGIWKKNRITVLITNLQRFVKLAPPTKRHEMKMHLRPYSDENALKRKTGKAGRLKIEFKVPHTEIFIQNTDNMLDHYA